MDYAIWVDTHRPWYEWYVCSLLLLLLTYCFARGITKEDIEAAERRGLEWTAIFVQMTGYSTHMRSRMAASVPFWMLFCVCHDTNPMIRRTSCEDGCNDDSVLFVPCTDPPPLALGVMMGEHTHSALMFAFCLACVGIL